MAPGTEHSQYFKVIAAEKEGSFNPAPGYTWDVPGKVGPVHHGSSKAVDKDPCTIQIEQGYSHLNNGQFDQAISDANKAIRLDPKGANAYELRARAYIRKGQHNQAPADVNKAIELDETGFGPPQAYVLRGKIFLIKGQYDLAIGDANKALENGEKEFAYSKERFNRIKVKFEDGPLGMEEISINVLPLAVIETSFKVFIIIPACELRGEAYLKKGQYDRAIADFTKAIETNPKEANAYLLRGIAYCDIGQSDLGISDLNYAKKLDPNLNGVDEQIAKCRGKLKNVVPKLPTRK